MHHRLLILVFLLSTLAVGCSWRESKCNPATWFKAKEVKADQPSGFLDRAGTATSSKLAPLFSVGAFLVAAGVMGGILLRSAGFGASACGTGLALISTGVLYTEYPWVTLLIPLCLIMLLAYTGWVILQSQKQNEALSVITSAVESAGNAGEKVKTQISSLGRDAKNLVREVIEPFKQQLEGTKSDSTPS